ncbi:pyridoxamine 5'-phosphate oxidase family protein [Lutibacter citreus]|uniref:pyridoxamine 5'-phosphate oxidase family protein n=1 Tax=Lutibacter citreus TaxID=2138210 RepID=UPI001FE93FE8|nr:pyridoxamine 5'-phosphate oxidase family protein [Lutibacter citreus]
MITAEIKRSIDKSVLCWLATSFENQPNISPKEVFTTCGENSIIIANIASPKSALNIKKTIKFVSVLLIS